MIIYITKNTKRKIYNNRFVSLRFIIFKPISCHSLYSVSKSGVKQKKNCHNELYKIKLASHFTPHIAV